MDQISFDDLFMDEKIDEIKPKTEATPLQSKIVSLLQPGKISALEICEKLMELGIISTERFSTNKPKAYGQICIELEGLVSQGKLVFIEDKERTDRMYKLAE